MSKTISVEEQTHPSSPPLDGFGLLVFFLAFLKPLWRAGVAPSWGGDAADMVAAFSLLASQDGAYPLSTTLLHLWTALPLGNVPFRLLLLGSILLGATSWCGYKIALELCRQSALCQKPWLKSGHLRFLLMLPTLIAVGLLHSFGSLSVSATFQAGLCLWLLLLFLRLPYQTERPLRALAGLAVLVGLAFFNHPLTLLWLTPCFVLLAFRSRIHSSLTSKQWVLLGVLLVSGTGLLAFHWRPKPPLLRKLESLHERKNPSFLTRRNLSLSLSPMLRLHRSLSHRGETSFVWLFWVLMIVGGLTLAVKHRQAGAALLLWLLGGILLGMWSHHALHSDIGCLLVTIICSSLVGFALVFLGQQLLDRLHRLSPNRPSRTRWMMLFLVLLVLPLVLPEFWFDWRKRGAAWSWQPLLLSEVLEEPLPRGALIIANSSEWYTLRLYRRLVEGQRPDLMLVLPYKGKRKRGPQGDKGRRFSHTLPRLTRKNPPAFLKKLRVLAMKQAVCVEWFEEFPKKMAQYLHPLGGLFQWLPKKQVKVDKYGQAVDDRSFAAQQSYFWKQAYKALSLSDATNRGDLRQWLLRIHLAHARVYYHSSRWTSGLQEIRLAATLAGQHQEVLRWKKRLQTKLEESRKMRERSRTAVPMKAP